MVIERFFAEEFLRTETKICFLDACYLETTTIFTQDEKMAKKT
jgi:hypothetical protein